MDKLELLSTDTPFDRARKALAAMNVFGAPSEKLAEVFYIYQKLDKEATHDNK